MSGRLILWRHGQSEWNADGRVQGQTDIGLTPLGLAQAAAAAPFLAARKPAVLVSSDLRRAADTAAQLAALTGLTVHQDARLRERSFGEWQGLTLPEVAERWPAEYTRWRAGYRVDGCGVEDVDVLAKRASAAFLEAADRAPEGTVVVTAHGAAIRHGLLALLGWPDELGSSLRALGNCHWCELTRDTIRGWQLRSYNVGVLEPAAAR